jgi:hypothetical protein
MLLPDILGEVLRRDASVIHEDVEAFEFVEGALNRSKDLVEICYVHPQWQPAERSDLARKSAVRVAIVQPKAIARRHGSRRVKSRGRELAPNLHHGDLAAEIKLRKLMHRTGLAASGSEKSDNRGARRLGRCAGNVFFELLCLRQFSRTTQDCGARLEGLEQVGVGRRQHRLADCESPKHQTLRLR